MELTLCYMTTAHLTTVNPFQFGYSLITQMISVHLDVPVFSVEDVNPTSVWQWEHQSVWSAQTPTPSPSICTGRPDASAVPDCL